MQKMSEKSMKKVNGGCQHWAYCLISKKKGIYSLYLRYKYTWLCAKCGRTYVTYST